MNSEIFNILAVLSWSGIQTQFPLTQKPGFIMTVICDLLGTAKLIHLLSLFSSKMCWFVLLWGENNNFMTFILSGIKVLFSDFHNGAAPGMTKKANVGTSFCSCLQQIPPELICSSRVACLPVFGSDFWLFSQWTTCRVRKGSFLPFSVHFTTSMSSD